MTKNKNMSGNSKHEQRFREAIIVRGYDADEVIGKWTEIGGYNYLRKDGGDPYDKLQTYYPQFDKLPQEGNCLCGHLIFDERYVSSGKNTTEILIVGNCCVNKFGISRKKICDKCGEFHRNRKVNKCNSCRGICYLCGVEKSMKKDSTCKRCNRDVKSLVNEEGQMRGVIEKGYANGLKEIGVMRRGELVRIGWSKLGTRQVVFTKNIVKLESLCRDKGIRVDTGMSKFDLLNLLYPVLVRGDRYK